MRHTHTIRSGFSLIELLVVIAIIAILAALIFPVFNRVKEQQRQEQCMQQMHDLYQSLRLFEEDNNKYPSSLLGFVQANTGGFYTGAANQTPVPVQQIIYKPVMSTKHVVDINEFICPDETTKDWTKLTTAIYPANLGSALAGQPVTFTPTIQHNTGNDNNANFPLGQNAYFYAIDAYDTGPQLDASGNVVAGVTELHYSLDWTGQSGPSDPTNQLKYAQTAPPARTIITWCTYHAAVNHSDKVLVLLANGTMKPVNAVTFVQKGPLNLVP